MRVSLFGLGLAVVFLIHRLFPQNCAYLSYLWGISPLFPNPIPLVVKG
jgi:hypothetical protein